MSRTIEKMTKAEPKGFAYACIRWDVGSVVNDVVDLLVEASTDIVNNCTRAGFNSNTFLERMF